MTTTVQASEPKSRPAALPTFNARILGVFYGIWLALFPVADFLLRPPIDRASVLYDQVRIAAPQLALALFTVAMIGPALAAVGAVVFGVDFRRAKYLALPAFVICVCVPLSLVATNDIQNFVFVILVYSQFLSAIVAVSTNIDRRPVLQALFATLAIAHGLTLIMVLIDHDFLWGRLYGRNSSNYWGMVAQTMLLASIAMRGWVLRAAVIVVAAVVLYFTQSRGSMVAAAAGLAVAFFIYAMNSRLRIWLWLSAALGLLVIAVLGADFITNDLLMLSDPGRGVGSGVSGRASAWRESWDLFASHPWLGVGYRQHERFLVTEASAHNAYLAMLADMGVVGLLAYLLFVFGGLWRAVTRAIREPSPTALASAAFLSAFVVNGMVERAALDSGTAYGQLMVVVAAWAWRLERPNIARRPSWD